MGINELAKLMPLLVLTCFPRTKSQLVHNKGKTPTQITIRTSRWPREQERYTGGHIQLANKQTKLQQFQKFIIVLG